MGGGLVLEPLNVGGGDSNPHPSFVKRCQFFGQRATDKTDRFFFSGRVSAKKSVFDQKWFFFEVALKRRRRQLKTLESFERRFD